MEVVGVVVDMELETPKVLVESFGLELTEDFVEDIARVTSDDLVEYTVLETAAAIADGLVLEKTAALVVVIELKASDDFEFETFVKSAGGMDVAAANVIS